MTGPPPCIVILVDNKTRDLAVAVLLAHHLAARGITAFLEPLEAYQAALAAHRPRLILFNHLTASHLAAYSRRLQEMGVLTAVLPNEGIFYDHDDLIFNSGRYHTQAHIDCFFCWNHVHAAALREHGGLTNTRIEVVGVPRFDFYFPPWSRLYQNRPRPASGRPVVLLCTNFVTAHFWELPRAESDKFFAAWKDRIPRYRNYWRSVEAHHRGRQRLPAFLNAIVAADRYHLIVRPHPRENQAFYRAWWEGLPPRHQAHVAIEPAAGITELILGCDVEISCETCTTALESWIAGKPTIELLLERDPLWYYEEPSACNVHCSEPAQLPALIEAALAGGIPAPLAEARRAHLRKWCHSPAGNSAERMAAILAETLARHPEPDWSKLTLTDHRRRWKWRLTNALGEAYHYDPLLSLKHRFWPEKYQIKYLSYRKAVRRADISAMRQRLLSCLSATSLPDNPGPTV